MHINRDLLDRALLHLLQLIERGIEYPDAEWCTTQRFNVPAAALRDAYDNHCIEER